MRPFFLRRLKKDVEKELPQKTEVIVRCPLSRRQKYLYDEFIAHENKKQSEVVGMMNILMQLKKVCNHPDLFVPRSEDTPLRWPKISLIVASYAVFREFDGCPQLRDGCDSRVSFDELALQLLEEYEGVKFNKFNHDYYLHKYQSRMSSLAVNYERSRWKPHDMLQMGLYSLVTIGDQSLQSKITQPKSLEDRCKDFEGCFEKFMFIVPKAETDTHQLVPMKFITQYDRELRQLEMCR